MKKLSFYFVCETLIELYKLIVITLEFFDLFFQNFPLKILKNVSRKVDAQFCLTNLK